MQQVQAWVAAHATLMTVLVWPLVSMLINAVFDIVKMHEKDSAFARCLDAFLSAAGLDAGKAIAALKGLFSGGSSSGGGSGADKALRPYDPDFTPTSPSRIVKRTSFLLAVCALVGCLALRDAVTFTADGAKCVVARTDKGETVAQALVPCGIEVTPEALKFFGDLVAEHKTAAAARTCAPDAGPK